MKDPREILAQMTLEEKAAICDGADFWHLKGMEKYGNRGFLLTLADIWSRGKDRAVVYNGLPKGYRTMAPINIAIAESYTCDSVDIYEDYLLTLDKDTLVMINNEYSNERS